MKSERAFTAKLRRLLRRKARVKVVLHGFRTAIIQQVAEFSEKIGNFTREFLDKKKEFDTMLS